MCELTQTTSILHVHHVHEQQVHGHMHVSDIIKLCSLYDKACCDLLQYAKHYENEIHTRVY